MEYLFTVIAVGFIAILNLIGLAKFSSELRQQRRTREMININLVNSLKSSIIDLGNLVEAQGKKTRKDIQEVKTAQRQVRKDLNKIEKGVEMTQGLVR